MLCPPTRPIPPAPIVSDPDSFRRARTDWEMYRDIVCRGIDSEGPFLLIKAGRAFPLWFSRPCDLAWKYWGDREERLWIGWWIFKINRRVRLLVFRPLEVGDTETTSP